MKSILPGLQQLGRALMLPIAVLPIAGLLLRLGQADLLDIPFVAASGAAIFGHLGLVFAIGIAVGFARENHGAAGLAAAVSFLIATEGAKALIVAPPDATANLPEAAHAWAIEAFKNGAANKFSMPVGILCGLLSGALYNRFFDIRLPDYLAFFGGRRFVPIAAGLAGVALACIFGLGWPNLERGMDAASRAVIGAGEAGLFLYGVLNRLLIVTGLHHILNNIAWFLIGDFEGVTGDLNRFFKGDPSAGAFMTGFFPVMMFGLPAACLAMYHAARPERRKAVGGLLLSMALTSFLTGVTEPVEFTFMFLAPVLYLVHALLTGAAHVIMDLLNVKLGFTFSAGAIDYALSYNRGTNAWMLLPVGLVYSALYYGLFRFCIQAFNLATPGREREPVEAAPVPAHAGARGEAFVRALGGAENLDSIDACTTRLRLIVRDQKAVDEAALRALGARGFVRPSDRSLQVVLGPIADQVAGEMRAAVAPPPRAGEVPSEAKGAGARVIAPSVSRSATASSPASGGAANIPSAEERALAERLLAALGGVKNIRSLTTCASRLRVEIASAEPVREADIRSLRIRGLVRTAQTALHILIGPRAPSVEAGMRALM